MFGNVREGVRRIFRLALHLPRLGREDARAELEGYIAAREESLMRRGLSPAAAHDEALRRLGGSFEHTLHDLERSAESREKRMRFRDYLDDLRDDIRFALRALAREKLVASFIVITLALGIGANAAMFGVVDRLLISGPASYTSSLRMMRFYRTRHVEGQGDNTGSSFGWVSYDNFKHATQSFAGVAAYAVNSSTFGRGADATSVPFGAVTWDFFPLFNLRPQAGRFFTEAEDSPDAPEHVVVLGDGAWRRFYGGDTAAIGKKMVLGDEEYTIVGVAPHGFTGPQLGPVDFWVPMSLRSRSVTSRWTTSWNSQWLRIVGRLRPGVSVEQASTDATQAYQGAYVGNDATFRQAKLWVAPLSFDTSGKETTEVTISRWLLGVAAIVLLIACANVANLLLARAVRRRREVAVRVALGAGRGRLVRLLLTESVLLSGLGAIAGLAVAWGVAMLMRNVLLPGLDWPSAPVDYRVFSVAMLIGAGVGVLTGLVPALRASRPDLTAALKSGAREGGGQASHLRGALTIAQAALSIVLLVGAGLFVRSLMNVRAVDLGIQPDRVIVSGVRYPTAARAGDPGAAGEFERRRQVYLDAMRRARTLPSVEQASLAIGLPFYSSYGQFLRISGWDSIPQFKAPGPFISAITAGYFETVGTRIIEGRGFTEADRAGSESVVILSQAMASTFWPNKSALGDCLYWSTSKDSLNVCSRVVGIVANAHAFGLRELPALNYYIPFGQERGIGGTTLLVRPKHGMETDAQVATRSALLQIDPSISFVNQSVLQTAIDPAVRPWRMGAAIFAMMGLLALVVAAVGLYSVLSYLVAQRTREIGVRIALGAQASTIVGLVLRSSVGMAATGVAIGLVIALWAGRYVEPLLFNESARDPWVMGGTGATLLLVSIAASVVPALRAKRVDPMEALRAE